MMLLPYAFVQTSSNVQYLTKMFVECEANAKNVNVVGASIIVDSKDWPGVIRVANDLKSDLTKVTGSQPTVAHQPLKTRTAIVVGTIGKSPLIDQLVTTKKLNVDGVKGQWESYVVQTVKDPFPGVEQAVVIAGSDKRGTIFGTYEMSEQSGVSPWYWWADVPIKKHAQLSVKPGRYVQASPKVKYRGIFINDEAPCLSNWVYKNFGEYKHEFYIHVFELLLRLRANYLWPAMWNNCFNEDDPLNPKLADEYGIVMGTSHVEPMGRADKEWNRLGYKPEQWNYLKSPVELDKFWADGVRRNKPYETINTIAMRGKIDTPMSEEDNIELLEKIVASQRKIIAREVNPDVTKVPQLWCLYKEVQNYYDKGMRVPDDVTLLWADDNWGNIRRLPTAEERNRSGGAGVYYHFDYVGGPRNYKWVDTNPLPRIWEQMHMAYERKADRIWIVNVGDIKPNEFPTEFFIRMGWDPDRWNQNTLGNYTKNWVSREFGLEHAEDIAELLEKYAKFNGRRKPELLDPTTYSLVNYREAEKVVDDYDELAKRSKNILATLPVDQQDAFFQLVHYPVAASANLNSLYIAAGLNHLYAHQGRASANVFPAIIQQLFDYDRELQQKYHSINNSKWDHMMDQTHIGYDNWQQPEKDTPPAVKKVAIEGSPRMGVAVEGQTDAVETEGRLPLLSAFSSQDVYFEVFNRGADKLSFIAKPKEPWIRLTTLHADLVHDKRVYVTADWSKVPATASSGTIELEGSDGRKVSLVVPVRPLGVVPANDVHGYVEQEGYISIPANGYKKKSGSSKANFVDLPDLGRDGSAVTIFPTTAPNLAPATDKIYLEYPIYLFQAGAFKIDAILSPTQHLQPTKGLRYAISIDDQPPVEVNMHESYVYFTPTWEASVAQNAIIRRTALSVEKPGRHIIRFWAIDPGVVLQKIIVDTGGLKRSYLGPPSSTYIEARK